MPNDDDEAVREAARVARKVATRRIKRRLKASVALGLGIAAGIFLACTRATTTVTIEIPPPPPNPNTPDARTALVLRNDLRDAAVDREEHRKGMPVPDNLLE